MKLNRKAIVAAAIIASAASFSAPSAFAAGADSFSDVPKDHWAYEALDYLAKEGVVDGYTDGTFEGNRTMSRYEMAAIVYKACQNENISIGGRAVLDKLRAEYDAEIKQLNTRVDKVEKDVEELKKAQVNGFFRIDYSVDQNSQVDGLKRYLMDLNASYKVNDNWTAKIHEETNMHYTGKSEDSSSNDSGIHRHWIEGTDDNGNTISIGRAWRGLGMQGMMYGNECDGVMAGIKLGDSLAFKPFYISRDSGRENGQPDYNSFYGAAVEGALGHNLNVAATYAKSSSKNAMYDGNAWGLAASTNIAKNLKFIGDYVRVGNDADLNGATWGLRLNYKDTDLQDKGSFGAYLRYVKTGEIFGIGGQGDTEWSTYEANVDLVKKENNSSRTWILGFKYVPAKNIEWHTMFGFGHRNYADQAKDGKTTRNFFRTMVDFHF